MEHNRLFSTRDESARVSFEAVIAFLEMQVGDLDAEMLELVCAEQLDLNSSSHNKNEPSLPRSSKLI
jgi:hypothetical protein